MRTVRIALALAALVAVPVFLPIAAFAAADSTVSGADFVGLVKPYLDAIVYALISAVLAIVAGYVKKLFGLQIDSKQRESLSMACRTAAGRVLASVEGNVSQMSFDVGNPGIAMAVRWVLAAAPDAISHFGITESQIAELIVGKIGQLQAGASS